jgi:hypothetical protein
MRETMDRLSETSSHIFNAQQSGVEPDLHTAHNDIDDNVFAITPSRPAAVEEDGSDSGFPAANGNSGSCVGHGSPERTS